MEADYRAQAARAVRFLAETAKLSPDDLVVLGCSTSEILGGHIGKVGSPEVGEAVVQGALDALLPFGASLCVQCCEHLNRALVLPRAVARARGYEIVRAVPYPHAGGSAGAAAYRLLDDAVLVEHVRAEAGLDIGDTLVGMHLRDVAVPLRPPEDVRVGGAHLVMATTRPKYIGGQRARYE